MASVSEHAKTVLSAIIPSRRDLLDKALRQLTTEHFPEQQQRVLFRLLEKYWDNNGGVMPVQNLDDDVKDVGLLSLITETYELYSERKVDDSEFYWSVQQLRELAAEKATGESLVEALEILRQGKTTTDGEIIQGHVDARQHLLESFSSIDRELVLQDAPEGDIQDEEADILTEYQLSKTDKGDGINLGIGSLDAKVGGMHPGELIMSVGYSSDGKTSLCVQAAWHAAVVQGKNVVFLTTETSRATTRRKLIARHSMLQAFKNKIPTGLNSWAMKEGSLSSAEESHFQDVVRDLTHNPAYGKIYIAQIPRAATMASVEQKLYRLQRKFNIDLVIMDYLALLQPSRKRGTVREELADIIKEAKQIAVTFDGGRGIPFMSPWQVNRASREQAEKDGMYTSRALGETSEATNSADIIISLLAPTDNTSRFAEIIMQVLKNRDGGTANGLSVRVDYATSEFASTGSAAAGFGATTRADAAFAFLED